MLTPLRTAVTVDLHSTDDPEDIRAACEALRARGIRASFFVPSKVLRRASYRDAAREIVRNGHEAAAHSHGFRIGAWYTGGRAASVVSRK